MKKISKIFTGALCLCLFGNVCLAQTTPIDAVAPGPHLFFETKNIVVVNSVSGPTLTFDLYLSASQAYVDYVAANGAQFGLESVDVAYDIDFGANGTSGPVTPTSRNGVKVSNQLNAVQTPLNLQGNSPSGYDTKFKFTLFRLQSSDPLLTTPTHVVSMTMTWAPGVVIGTPGTSAAGAKIQLRCAQTGYGTGLSGSKWGDLSGNSQNIVGSSSSLVALPVVLVNFTALKEGNSASLSWTTTEESNSDYFEVQRSLDGKKWGKVTNIPAKGESKELQHYTAVDSSPLNGNNLYRLKMVDKDKTFALSKIQNVEFDLKTQYTLHPNPVSDKLNFKSTEDWDKVTKIQIYNVQGAEVYTSPSSPKREINVRNLASGTYVVKLTRSNNQVSNYRIVIAR